MSIIYKIPKRLPVKWSCKSYKQRPIIKDKEFSSMYDYPSSEDMLKYAFANDEVDYVVISRPKDLGGKDEE